MPGLTQERITEQRGGKESNDNKGSHYEEVLCDCSRDFPPHYGPPALRVPVSREAQSSLDHSSFSLLVHRVPHH